MKWTLNVNTRVLAYRNLDGRILECTCWTWLYTTWQHYGELNEVMETNMILEHI
jgi:hypothetical protein